MTEHPEPAGVQEISPDPPTGLLLVDKPSGVTSHDVVGRIRALLSTRRVGHAGTLDPMATGLLLVAVGRATKLLGHLSLAEKSYTATMRLGAATTTDDAEGEVVSRTDAVGIGDDVVRAAMAAWTGDIDQVPSSVSAVKVDGRRAYARVRAGENVQLAPRRVTVSRFEMVAPPRRSDGAIDVDVIVQCSTGTYVRALARDVGAALGVGGHLVALRRQTVGPFAVDEAIDVFPTGIAPRGAPRPPIPPESRTAAAAAVVPVGEVARLAFPVREASTAEAADLRHGRAISARGIDGTYAVLDRAGDLVALVSEARDAMPDAPRERAGSGGAARPVFVWQAD